MATEQITLREAIIIGTHCQSDRIDATNALAVYREAVNTLEADGHSLDSLLEEESAHGICDELFWSLTESGFLPR